MLRAGFEPAIPASERPLTHALGRAVAAIGTLPYYGINWNVRPAVRHTELSAATVNIKWNNCLDFMKPKTLFPSVPLRSVKQAYQRYTQLCGL